MALGNIKKIVPLASIIIFSLCTLAAILILNSTKFKMDGEDAIWTALGLYFLAKGIFCSLTLYILSEK